MKLLRIVEKFRVCANNGDKVVVVVVVANVATAVLLLFTPTAAAAAAPAVFASDIRDNKSLNDAAIFVGDINQV